MFTLVALLTLAQVEPASLPDAGEVLVEDAGVEVLAPEPIFETAAPAESTGPLATITGYVDSRTTGAWTQFDGAPGLTELLEANAQLKLTPHERVTFYTDTSLFWQGAWLINGGDRDLANYRPSVVLSEAYGDFTPVDHFRVLVGKKRIVWGSGLSFNPTDVLNPPKDPTDPTFQRAGAWLAQAEWSFERVALSLVGAGKVTRQYAGLPTALIVYPDHPTAEADKGIAPDDRDDEAHFAFTARLYLLLADIDVNVIYAYTNLYNDAFAKKSKVGLSLSRVFGNLEVHGEAMLYSGSSRLKVNSDCVEQPFVCALRGVPVVSRPDLDASWLNTQALVGARYQFDNGAIALEYYFNGEGLNRAAYRDLATLVVNNPTVAQQALGASSDPGTPQKFTLNAFRQHYLVLNGNRSQIFDDWTVSGALILGLEDLSMQLVPQVQWQPKEWLQLTLAVYVPFQGLDAETVSAGDATYGQFTLSPFQTRVLFQARAFF
jgi:hypothetical protein